MMVKEEFAELYARLDDLCTEAARGGMGVSAFLSPRELHFALSYLQRAGVSVISFGGYENAERRRICVLPEYLEGISDASELEAYGFDVGISAVLVHTYGYRALSHRDYLGSILGLGIERSVIGDILVLGDNGEEAVVFCADRLCDFFCSELSLVAREKAVTKPIALSAVVPPQRRFAAINDTVASPRLDCVVGAICSLSREKARDAVVSGLVELDFENEERPDRAVSAPCIISVRGYGRFRVLSLCDKTRKGRYRLSAEKFL